jgi:anti-sigma regulatory factor (Ser/Thr protein kinase)
MQNEHTTANISNVVQTDSPQGSSVIQAPISLCFDVSADISNITHLRKTARCLLESLGLSRENTDDVETLIGELSTNAVRHAYAHTEKGTYKVSLEFHENRVIVTVIDEGVGFVEDAVLPPGSLRTDTFSSENRFGGLGLPLIHAIADHVEIRPTDPHGTTVRAEKTLP